MSEVKERILLEALALFARDGYSAVSVSMIASRLGMTKGALYRHYRNKRDIFDSVVLRMAKNDAERAASYGVPEETYSENAKSYGGIAADKLGEYCKAQFRYWAEDGFASLFRRLVSLERYRDAEMAALYENYLGKGPLSYVEDVLRESLGISEKKAAETALALYSPFFLLLSVYDSEDESARASVIQKLDGYIDSFTANIAARQLNK